SLLCALATSALSSLSLHDALPIYQGRMRAGVVFDPLRNELFHAEAGKGAFLNEEPIHCSEVRQLKEAHLAAVDGLLVEKRSLARLGVEQLVPQRIEHHAGAHAALIDRKSVV